jgi:predicted PurR-regulated permease PerM
VRRSNWLYVLNQALTMDLVFWIVIQNLFLSTVKDFSAFDIVLCTLVGIAISLIFYPLVNMIARKTPRRFSLIARAAMYLIAMVMFTFCGTIYGITAAEVIYIVGSMLGTVQNVMLKNNLNAQIELKRKSICDNLLQESACSRCNSNVLANEKTNTALSSYFDGCISLM